MNMTALENGKCFYSGSTANLYKVRFGKLTIVKILREEYINNQAALKRFMQEKSIVEKLRLHNVPHPVFVDLATKRPYFAYEYIEGTHLNELIQSNHISQLCSIGIIRRLLILLISFKDAGLVHSDITPDNILLDSNGKVFLIDFGCSDFPLRTNMTTSTWISKYTYCSPEQAQGKRWSFQSDLYQVGSLFYEMLCGQRINMGQGREALAMAANPQQPELLTIPEKYWPVLMALLEPKIEKRCGSPCDALILLNNIP